MDLAITKMSSKGQIVIPTEMRKDIKEGDKLVLIRDEERLVLKKADRVTKKLMADLEFAKRTEEAWKRYEKGEFIEMESDEFLKEIEIW